jgi:hypothetical protein
LDEKKFELLDFKVTDLKAHVNTAVGKEMQLHVESRMGSQTPVPPDGTLYMFLNIKIFDGEENNFLFDITTTTVIQLPEGMTEITDDDVPKCLELASGETHRAVREMTSSMGITPMDLDAQ